MRYCGVFPLGLDDVVLGVDEADPDERKDLSDERPEVAADLRGAIHDRFDPDAIDEAETASIRRRTLIDGAIDETG